MWVALPHKNFQEATMFSHHLSHSHFPPHSFRRAVRLFVLRFHFVSFLHLLDCSLALCVFCCFFFFLFFIFCFDFSYALPWVRSRRFLFCSSIWRLYIFPLCRPHIGSLAPHARMPGRRFFVVASFSFFSISLHEQLIRFCHFRTFVCALHMYKRAKRIRMRDRASERRHWNRGLWNVRKMRFDANERRLLEWECRTPKNNVVCNTLTGIVCLSVRLCFRLTCK